eukprot:2059764-Pyramimonas_sp.AAC.1
MEQLILSTAAIRNMRNLAPDSGAPEHQMALVQTRETPARDASCSLRLLKSATTQKCIYTTR